MLAALASCSRIPSPAFTSRKRAPAATAPGALGEPARAAATRPFVRTSCPSFVGHPGSPAIPQSGVGWTFGIAPAASATTGLTKCPWSSSGAVSQRLFGEGGAVLPGKFPAPAHGTVPVGSGSKVLASLNPDALHTV